MLDGAPPATAPDDDAIREAVEGLLGDGVSARDAASEVAAALGVPKRRAYAIAIAARRHP